MTPNNNNVIKGIYIEYIEHKECVIKSKNNKNITITSKYFVS